MADDTLMTLGSIVFVGGSILFLVTALLSVGLPGLASGPFFGLVSIVSISGASAVAGIVLFIIGGLREGDRRRLVYVRRAPSSISGGSSGPPRFCLRCGSTLVSGQEGLICPACGLCTQDI